MRIALVLRVPDFLCVQWIVFHNHCSIGRSIIRRSINCRIYVLSYLLNFASLFCLSMFCRMVSISGMKDGQKQYNSMRLTSHHIVPWQSNEDIHVSNMLFTIYFLP